MAKYEIKRYNFETKKTIDIHKKEPQHKLSKKDITNLSLVALRRNNLDFSRNYESFKQKILELNAKIKDKPTKVLVKIVRQWLAEA